MKKLLKHHTFPIILLLMIFLITSSTQAARAQNDEPWSAPTQVSAGIPHSDGIALAVDASSRVHLVWSQGSSDDAPTTSLFYTGLEGQLLTQAVQIVGAPSGEMARQPSLLVDGVERLHLAYSGGEFGEIFYTSADASLAASAGGWLEPQILSYAPGAAWPQIALAPDGSLYVVYVVRVNERRGVYWLRSTDGGREWNDTALIFDAAAAGWDSVGQPALAIAPDGGLHVVFERAAFPDTWPSRGLFYTSAHPAPEGELVFSPPEAIAPAGSLGPRLSSAGGGVHLVYQGRMGLEGRRLDLFEPEVGWLAVEYLAGWQYGTAGVAPFGLAADAQNAHLVGPLSDPPGLRYSAWLGEAQVGWTNPPERVDFTPPQPTPAPPLEGEEPPVEEPDPLPAVDTPLLLPRLMAAAARFQGGRLAAAWAVPAEDGMAVFVALRPIPLTSAEAVAPIPPTRTPTSTVTPTPEPPPGTPTPNLNVAPPAQPLPIDPIYLAGGLAASAVLLVVGVTLIVWNRRR